MRWALLYHRRKLTKNRTKPQLAGEQTTQDFEIPFSDNYLQIAYMTQHDMSCDNICPHLKPEHET